MLCSEFQNAIQSLIVPAAPPARPDYRRTRPTRQSGGGLSSTIARLAENSLDDRHEIACAERQQGIVEVVAGLMEHASALGGTGADPGVAARLRFQHVGEVLRAHAGRKLRADIVEPEHVA